MDKLPMCRICLVENVNMCIVVNKNLQELYEKLTDIPFVTKDSRPILACFFCCAKLKQCFRFLRKCLEAEELFAQMMNGDYEPNPPSISQDDLHCCTGFIKSPTVHISIVDECETDSIAIKEEVPAICERQDDVIEPKEEYQSDDVDVENLNNTCLGTEDIPPHLSVSVKLDVAEEQELTTKKRRAVETNNSPAVAEEPKLYLRRTKLEDSIPAEQETNQTSDSKLIRANQNRTSKYITKFKKPHECEVCHYTFSNKSNLTDHIRTHTGEKPYMCDICQSSFRQKRYLTTHVVRTHTGIKPYKCDICQRSFSRKEHLERHYLTHTGEKPYKCDICQRCFSLKYSLTSHISTHTGLKPYKCDICPSSFCRKRNLTKHIRTHTGEKPYKCDICQRCFSVKLSLTSHISTHTGLKPYKCDICPSSFRLKRYLTVHIRTHTGVKPYKCDICRKSFSQKVRLTRHIRIHL